MTAQSDNGHHNDHQEIAIGMLCADDATALERVAQRDSAAVPHGRVLGARVDGTLVAALSVDGGGMVADPFVPTAEVRRLLAERAAQLRGRRTGGPLGRLMVRRAARTELPASRGAGGQLLRI